MIVVYAPGCWDLLHVGHVRFLERAKRLGDKLIVGVASDSVVLQDKGRPPVIGQDQRREMLEALLCVDYVTIYPDFGFVSELQRFAVDVLAVGPQWGTDERHWNAEIWIKTKGGRVIVIDRTEGVSTTDIRRG